ncbi:S-layer homology domain-containing protein [Bacillus thuringiensis]|uniref:S-layer homology domain-containing protein n=1 Tax=Bacillus thuringiensis TaxID=1428 RepID=UPI002DBC9C9D|nr:S-layer homology domain-containing protein [Bacillus thuringiensis]MEC2727736.1 S-layer homology domain-containing protein [Bacillus thuringiensis]MEC2839975.1 S-layer homology domain-containing protein [Bacillus thuringiensis]MEC3323226.1 S-layer homology domain-containing protein [Bacillus thuringiensis]MEC3490035.1 S-layer homology domain-containing protein [Bacillus thuringiensis]MEC3493627.1 S-layer homology domain-containing protein [Bacillus thuringiensis]
MKKTILTTTAALTMMGTGMGINVDHIKPAEVKADTISFYDVPNNHWATKAITNLANRNIVVGYGNGQFGFGDNVTRGQVARMIYNYLKPADAGNFKNPFSDIKGHMFEKEILALAKLGIIKGYGEGKFGPDDILTREQMAQVLTNAFKFEGTKNTSFVDVDKNSWSYKAIGALEEKGVTIGTGGKMYSPTSVVTREQYSQFLFNSINVIEKETKPEEKPNTGGEVKPEEKPNTGGEVKPEEKPNTGGEVKPEEKPNTGGEVKPEEKPNTDGEVKPEEKPNTGGEVKPEEKPNTGEETKPVNVPEWLETSLATDGFTFTQAWYDGSEVVNKAASTKAQQIVKNINGKYGTNLKYSEVGAIVKLVDGSKAQFRLAGIETDDFQVTFRVSNDAMIELTKEFVSLINSSLNLDQEIQEIPSAPMKIKNVEKGDYKIHISPTMEDQMISIQITKK